MTTVKINRLTLENFKCHRLLNLCLDGADVTIYGDNAVLEALRVCGVLGQMYRVPNAHEVTEDQLSHGAICARGSTGTTNSTSLSVRRAYAQEFDLLI